MSIDVSVLMPTFRPNPDHFKCALESVLGQTGLNALEIVVVDDSPDDSVEAVIRSLGSDKIVYFRGRRQGISDALNLGYRECRYSYVARMDADDLCAQDRLRNQVEFMRRNSIQICGSNAIYKGAAWGAQRFPPGDSDIKFALAFGCPISHPSVVVDRMALGDDMSYDDGLTVCEDYALWTKLAMKGHRFANVQRPLLRYRVHDAQATQLRKDVTLQTADRFRRSYWKYYFQDTALSAFVDDERFQTLEFSDHRDLLEFIGLFFYEAARRHVEGSAAFRVLYPTLMKQSFIGGSLFIETIALMRRNDLRALSFDCIMAGIRASLGLHSDSAQIRALKRLLKYRNSN